MEWVVQTGPYLMARPRLARHMLDHQREQALTEHLGRERQGYEMGIGEQGPEGWAGPILTGCREKRLRNMGMVSGLLRLVRKELSADE